jgi:hypothetical protein
MIVERMKMALNNTFFFCLLFSPFKIKDVAWLASKLPNLKASIRVDYPYFNHWDFLWSVNVNELLYNRVLSLLPSPYYAVPNSDNNVALPSNVTRTARG